MTVNYCNILTLKIIGFFTAVIDNGKLPWYFYNIGPSGLYYKTIMIIIMTIVSDATIWSVTFDDAS
jgi:hypothetical protein